MRALAASEPAPRRSLGSKVGSLLGVVGLAFVALSALRLGATDVDRPRLADLPESRDSAVASWELVTDGPTYPQAVPLANAPENRTVREAPRLPALLAERVLIPRIDLESKVMEVAVSGGEWPVPKFAVGHLAESVNPGDLGNAVFAGHLLSLSSGNVFARLEELEVGDDIAFEGADGVRRFRVTETVLVRNTDLSVLADRPGTTTVTLITCAGRWLPKENDYDQRRVVVAEAVQA